LLSKAVEWDIIDQNPLEKLKLFPVPPKREVSLTEEEAATLIAKLPKPLSDIVEFAIYSDFRKENILGLQIEDICFHEDGGSGEITLKVKMGRKETFALSPQAVGVLKRVIGTREDGHVFINPRTGKRFVSIHKKFDQVVRELGLKVGDTKFRFHDLRHVFGSWLHSAGVPLDVLRNLMGHRDRATTDRYVTFDPKLALDALKQMPSINNEEDKNKLVLIKGKNESGRKMARIGKVEPGASGNLAKKVP
jgi:integrase